MIQSYVDTRIASELYLFPKKLIILPRPCVPPPAPFFPPFCPAEELAADEAGICCCFLATTSGSISEKDSHAGSSFVIRYPSSSLTVFFFITFRLPRRRPPVTVAGGSGVASLGTVGFSSVAGSAGGDGAAWSSAEEAEEASSIIFLRVASRSALESLLGFLVFELKAVVVGIRSPSFSESEDASNIGTSSCAASGG